MICPGGTWATNRSSPINSKHDSPRTTLRREPRAAFWSRSHVFAFSKACWSRVMALSASTPIRATANVSISSAAMAASSGAASTGSANAIRTPDHVSLSSAPGRATCTNGEYCPTLPARTAKRTRSGERRCPVRPTLECCGRCACDCDCIRTPRFACSDHYRIPGIGSPLPPKIGVHRA